MQLCHLSCLRVLILLQLCTIYLFSCHIFPHPHPQQLSHCCHLQIHCIAFAASLTNGSLQIWLFFYQIHPDLWQEKEGREGSPSLTNFFRLECFSNKTNVQELGFGFGFVGVLRHVQRYVSRICDGIDVQTDCRRSCTYGRAPNAINIS